MSVWDPTNTGFISNFIGIVTGFQPPDQFPFHTHQLPVG